MYMIEVSSLSLIRPELAEIYKKQKYQLIGKNSAVKKCHWLHQALRNGRFCYKYHFYGINSHRCIEMTPNMNCNQACLFCWRTWPEDLGLDSFYDKSKKFSFDAPKKLFDAMIYAQKKIISGYKPVADLDMWKEAMEPKHVAISLTGEPTGYPYLDEFIDLIHEHGMSSFLVTNGTYPKMIEKLKDSPPTQLYITLPGPDPTTYESVFRPKMKNGWERILESLEIASKFKTRTVARLTLAKHQNMKHPMLYAKLIEKMKPSFIELKGVVYVGGVPNRLTRENSPTHEEILNFGKELESLLNNYKYLDDYPPSTVMLLSSGKHDRFIEFPPTQ